MQGTIVKVAVEEGQIVEAGELVVVLEAMKMEQPLTAHKAGTITGLSAEVGATVTSGAVLCTIADRLTRRTMEPSGPLGGPRVSIAARATRTDRRRPQAAGDDGRPQPRPW